MDQVRRAEPAIAIDVPAMPDRIRVEGIEFVEFVAADQKAAELGSLLGRLGFARATRRLNKEVTLGRQGPTGAGINNVINTDREGFAHASYLVHGAHAYAIGSRVED